MDSLADVSKDTERQVVIVDAGGPDSVRHAALVPMDSRPGLPSNLVWSSLESGSLDGLSGISLEALGFLLGLGPLAGCLVFPGGPGIPTEFRQRKVPRCRSQVQCQFPGTAALGTATALLAAGLAPGALREPLCGRCVRRGGLARLRARSKCEANCLNRRVSGQLF